MFLKSLSPVPRKLMRVIHQHPPPPHRHHRSRRVRWLTSTRTTSRIPSRSAQRYLPAVQRQPLAIHILLLLIIIILTIIIDIIKTKLITPTLKMMNVHPLLLLRDILNILLPSMKIRSSYLVTVKSFHVQSLLASSKSGSGLNLVTSLSIIDATSLALQLDFFSHFFLCSSSSLFLFLLWLYPHLL